MTVPEADSEAGEVLDDFADLSGWSAVASGLAQLAIAPDDGPRGAAMRLDFDFKGGGGFVVARKRVPARDAGELRARLRSSAARRRRTGSSSSSPIRRGRNVWWCHRDAFEFPADWQPLRIRSSEVEFAWGPAGGGALPELGAIEIAIAAGPGGAGTVWLGDLRFEDLEPRAPPLVRASSARPGHAPASRPRRPPETSWRSAPPAGPQWLAIDFQAEREYGGLVVDWEPRGSARAFDVQRSDDGAAWTTLCTARAGRGRAQLRVPAGRRRRASSGSTCARAPAATASASSAIARAARRVLALARCLLPQRRAASERARPVIRAGSLREQSYWTPIGVASGSPAALLNEEGMVEVDRGTFSIEPFLFVDGRLVTWADAEIAADARGRAGCRFRRRCGARDELRAHDDGVRGGRRGRPGPLRALPGREHAATRRARVRFFCALRPFQVTPPWQAFGGLGGAQPDRRSSRGTAGAVRVDERKRGGPARPRRPASAPRRSSRAAIARALERGELPPRDAVRDAFGYASGALRFDLDLAPGARARGLSRGPVRRAGAGARGRSRRCARIDGAAQFDGRASATGAQRLGARPAPRRRRRRMPCVDALRTAAAHVLINRDGPALQPGPRRYTRSWIRDGAIMAAALLRMGCARRGRATSCAGTRRTRRPTATCPAASIATGPDWLAEHDSHGQLIFAVVEYFRFTRRPRVPRRAVAGGAAGRRLPRGAARAAARRRSSRRASRAACYGLLPESVSHEGYLAQPVHSYWDDFWALRGFGDAADLARRPRRRRRGRASARAARRAAATASTRRSRRRSRERELDYVPGLGRVGRLRPDGDRQRGRDDRRGASACRAPRSRAPRRVPARASARRGGEIDWNNYTAYEIRIVGALVRLGRRGRRARAARVLPRRPAPARLEPVAGDLLARSAQPRPPRRRAAHLDRRRVRARGAQHASPTSGRRTQSLVLAAGIRPDWLDGGGVAIANLPTWYGSLSYTLRARSATTACELSLAGDLALPPGGIVVRSPLPRPLARVTADDRAVMDFDAASARLDRRAASLILHYDNEGPS